MFEFHKDKQRYFEMQKETSSNFVLPFVENLVDFTSPRHILEIGCAEAGVLKAFTDLGHECTGIELRPQRVEIAKTHFERELKSGQIKFIVNDIAKIDIEKDIGHKFDLVILKDVIEHIPNQAAFINQLRSFLKPSAVIFFGFPPWQMPFGGHQQIASNKVLSKLPYYHMLPKFLYQRILSSEKDAVVKELLEIKSTGISIEKFQRIVKDSGFNVLKKQLFLINPIYKYKFNLKPRKQFPIIKDIPVLRNFVTTCAYYAIGL